MSVIFTVRGGAANMGGATGPLILLQISAGGTEFGTSSFHRNHHNGFSPSVLKRFYPELGSTADGGVHKDTLASVS